MAHFLNVVYLYMFGQHCSLPVLLVLATLMYCLFVWKKAPLPDLVFGYAPELSVH